MTTPARPNEYNHAEERPAGSESTRRWPCTTGGAGGGAPLKGPRVP